MRLCVLYNILFKLYDYFSFIGSVSQFIDIECNPRSARHWAATHPCLIWRDPTSSFYGNVSFRLYIFSWTEQYLVNTLAVCEMFLCVFKLSFLKCYVDCLFYNSFVVFDIRLGSWTYSKTIVNSLNKDNKSPSSFGTSSR